MKAIFLAVALLVASAANAKWVESQTMTIDSPRVHQGVTKKGNVKYYIVVSDGVNSKEVSVSKSNAESGVITLVKWVDDETGKIRYTTRSGKKRAVTPDMDLERITTK
jgi:hypothetical protein|nr:MAG: hypothetical protein [Bacteriophage sp.]